MNGTTKVLCSCKNEFQDKHYGPGVRIANATLKEHPTNNTVEVRCTVCSKIHTVKKAQVK